MKCVRLFSPDDVSDKWRPFIQAEETRGAVCAFESAFSRFAHAGANQLEADSKHTWHSAHRDQLSALTSVSDITALAYVDSSGRYDGYAFIGHRVLRILGVAQYSSVAPSRGHTITEDLPGICDDIKVLDYLTKTPIDTAKVKFAAYVAERIAQDIRGRIDY